MTIAEAEILIKEKTVNVAYNTKDATSLKSFVGRNGPHWVMDYKTLSTNREFLEAFVVLLDHRFRHLESFQVCGMESGALPFVTAVSLLSLKCKNAFYIRKSAKKHDLAKTIEGEPVTGLPIIVVDDILNSGSTIKKQMLVLAEKNLSLYASFSVLRFRDLGAYVEIVDKGVKVESIFTLNDFKNELDLSNIQEKKYLLLPEKWKLEWKIKFSNHNPYMVIPKSAPVSDKENVYIGGDDGYMRAISRSSGEIVWKTWITFGTGGKRIFSSPLICKGRIFFGAYDGNFYCLNASTGKREWVFLDADWIGSSPSVSQDGSVIYIGLEFGLFKKQGGVVALNTRDGSTLWSFYGMTGLTHASPVVSDRLGVVVCGCNDRFIYCFDQKKGKLLWKFETGGEVKYGASFDEKRKLVIVGSMDGLVYVISVVSGKLHASFSAEAGFYSSPIYLQDKIIIGSLDKKVYCFDLNKKLICWEYTTRGRVFASPVSYGESIFIGSNDGVLYEFNVETGEKISTVNLTERIVNKVVVSEENKRRVLYIATSACELYKFIEKKV